MGKVYKIQSSRENQRKKYVSGFTPLCEITGTTYNRINGRKYFLENELLDQRVI